MENIKLRNKRFLFISIIAIIYLNITQSCNLKNNNRTIVVNEYSFEEDSFTIRNVSKSLPKDLSYFDDDTNEILFYGYSGKIYFYNFKTDKTDSIRHMFNIEYANFYVINMDTLILRDVRPNKFHILETNRNKISTINYSRDSLYFSPSPYVGNCNPVLSYNSCIYCIGYILGESEEEKKQNRPILISYDFQNKKTNFFINYPKIYKDYNWGGIQYRFVFNTFNKKSNSIILSFPASHELYVYNLKNGEYKSYNAGSQYIASISPFSRKKDWYGSLAMSDYNRYFYLNPSYSGIFYDKYRDMYYRIAELPNKMFVYSNIKTYKKQKSIILLDNRFNYIGEKIISYDFDTYSIFVSKKGLNIFIRQDAIDNTFKIKVLTPQKIKL